MAFYLVALALIITAVVFSKYKAEDYAYKFNNSGQDIEQILIYCLRD